MQKGGLGRTHGAYVSGFGELLRVFWVARKQREKLRRVLLRFPPATSETKCPRQQGVG